MKTYNIYYSFSPIKTEEPKFEKPIKVSAKDLESAFKKAKERIGSRHLIARMYAKF